jgi:ABC-type polysaccharide/polyol phosphate transport system ATPase subunit
MSDIAISMEHVYKKFRKGDVYNSLRDLLPALTGRMFRQEELTEGDTREFWAVQDLSFEVKAGESFGIIGHNGAGKSTALKMLSRIMKPTKGRMVVNGRLSALIEVSAGFHADLTGRENIFLNGTILGMSRREIQSKLDQIIAFSGIEEFIDTPVKRYSSGMYARLGFSVAAHVDPDVLIVDEVLSVGDSLFQQKCVERMQEVLHSGAAVLFVSHNLKTVADFCDRCLLLDKGRTVMIGTPQDVISTYLQRSSGERTKGSSSGPVSISSFTVRDEAGQAMQFRPGQKAWVDVELTALATCKKVSVTLYMRNDKFDLVFDTSTDRLGYNACDLEAGDIYRCTFELDLNLADGTYYPSIVLYRYDIQTIYDRWEPAATMYLSSDGTVRGIAHCFPRVIQQEIVKAVNPAPLAIAGAESAAAK